MTNAVVTNTATKVWSLIKIRTVLASAIKQCMFQYKQHAIKLKYELLLRTSTTDNIASNLLHF